MKTRRQTDTIQMNETEIPGAMKRRFLKTAATHGVFMGAGLCLYTILMWLTGLDGAYLRFGQYLDMAIIVLPAAVIFRATRQENRRHKITLVRRIAIAILIGLVSYVIYSPFLYLYHHHINPQWFDSVLKLKQAELETAKVPQSEIAGTLQKMRVSNAAQAGMFKLSTFVPSVVVIPALLALVSMLFIRNRPNRNEG